MTERLSATRLAEFVQYAMAEDMQILANRRVARTNLVDSLLRYGEPGLYLDFPHEKFDKLLTYLSQNDLQVHGADASATVGIYSFVKIVGEIRRSLAKLPAPDPVYLGDRRPENEVIPGGYNPELLALVRSPRKEVPQASPSYRRMSEALVGGSGVEEGPLASEAGPAESARRRPVSRELAFSGEAPKLKEGGDGSGPKPS